VVGDHPARHTEEPETILRGRRDQCKTAPGDEKYLGDHVLDIVLDHAASDIRCDWLAVGAVERFESGRALVVNLERTHSARVHFSSFTQVTWPGQARIRQLSESI
jgi:hypothetical protein